MHNKYKIFTSASVIRSFFPTRWEKKKASKFSISPYIYKVLKQARPDTGISSKGMSIMNSFMTDMFEKIATEASRMLDYKKRAQITSRRSRPRSSPAAQGIKAMTKYQNSKNLAECSLCKKRCFFFLFKNKFRIFFFVSFP